MGTIRKRSRYSLRKCIGLDMGHVIVLGHSWVKDDIFAKVCDLKRTAHNARQKELLCESIALLGDIAFLMKGYGTAGRWYRYIARYLLEYAHEEILFDDIVFTYLLSGHYEKAKRFCSRSNFHFEFPNSFKVKEEENDIYNMLTMFRPKKVLRKYGDGNTKDIFRAVTLAYGALGYKQEVLSRLKFYSKKWKGHFGLPEIFFYTQDIFDDVSLWKILHVHKPCIFLIDNKFELIGINNKNTIDYTDMLLLHIARIENDNATLCKLKNKYPDWEICKKTFAFLEKNGRMPLWSELFWL